MAKKHFSLPILKAIFFAILKENHCPRLHTGMFKFSLAMFWKREEVHQLRPNHDSSSFPFQTNLGRRSHFLAILDELRDLSSRLTSSNDVRQPTSATSSKVRSILPEVFRNKLIRAQTCHALLLAFVSVIRPRIVFTFLANSHSAT
jgi:hypothetical protein